MNFSHSTLSFRSLLITVLVAAPGLAQDLKPFTNGTVANADDVNSNFTALKTAVTTAQTTSTGAANAAAAAQTTANAAQTAANAAATQTSFNTLSATVTAQGNSLTNLTGAIAVTGPKVELNRRLQLTNTTVNRKVVLFDSADNDHQYDGFGINSNVLRYQTGGTGNSHVFFAGASPTTSTELMRIQGNGRVGIGTNNPQARFHVNGSAPFVPGTAGSFFNFAASTLFPGNAFGPTAAAGGYDIGILCTNGDVACSSSYIAYSDARIKDIVGRSDTGRDLAILNGLEISDYTFKDVVTRGSRTQKKVIAQQVESVYPQAVSRSTEVVPDIYQRATQKDGWVTLATDLKVGERVRLIGEKEEGVHEVLEIGDGAFRTEFAPASEKVFVYGREVKDFRSVDYDAISMLNVSATQELARKVVTLETENEALKSRLASLEAMAARVAALEVAMQPLLAK